MRIVLALCVAGSLLSCGARAPRRVSEAYVESRRCEFRASCWGGGDVPYSKVYECGGETVHVYRPEGGWSDEERIRWEVRR